MGNFEFEFELNLIIRIFLICSDYDVPKFAFEFQYPN